MTNHEDQARRAERVVRWAMDAEVALGVAQDELAKEQPDISEVRARLGLVRERLASIETTAAAL